MTTKNILDAVTAPLIRKIAIYAGTALAGAVVSWAVSKGWIDAALGQQIVDAISNLMNGIGI